MAADGDANRLAGGSAIRAAHPSIRNPQSWRPPGHLLQRTGPLSGQLSEEVRVRDRTALPPSRAGCWPGDRHLVFRTADPGVAHRSAQSIMVRHGMEVDRAAGTFEASVHRAAIGEVDLLRFAYRAPTRIVSAPLDGFVTVHVPRRGTLQVAQHGREVLVAPGAAAVISTGSPVEMTWSADLDLLVVKVPETALVHQLTDLVDAPVSGRLTFDLLHRFDARSALAVAVDLAVRSVSGGGEVAGALASAVTRSLVTSLLLGHAHNHDEDVWTARPGPDGLVRAVVDAVRADPAGEHTTRRLADGLGVSERTLQLEFRRRAGTTPSAYVRGLRLEFARERLVQGGGATVLDVAVQCGFGHAGRFAAAYRERFGEAPAETVRRRRVSR